MNHFSTHLGWRASRSFISPLLRSGARRRSREIDAMLKRDRREPMVILLTGSQYAGTTNVLRQMRLINGPVFNHKELLEFREAIYNNIIENYLPHNQDVIYTRNRTTFEESDYDRTGHEDNCLVASLNDFELLCNHKSFLNSTIIIFFNKMDLLTEKVQTADIRKHFPEFQGDPQKLEDVQEFLIQSFQKRKWNNSRQIFYHMTTAVDTENIQTVFNTVKNTVMDRNLKEIPFL
ncbi:guanine nucleotide-binding subunit alpha-12 [Labeo rohita]|uniref:Guanine nucleotide-binding subunit alpha-12 n=1 Tax=Labeo rohita TaxID=84645 RepID=A0A498LHI5_LABRO|nr:guanine nucleotide-binding subunit alpha-12 [Labeo rohita]